MTRNELKQYRALQKEIDSLDKDIDKLNKQLGTVPTVAGKVQASEKDWPYIERHVTVEMEAPKQADSIKRRIQLKQTQKDAAETKAKEIEDFIAGVDDSIDRQILEHLYIDGLTQEQTAEMMFYSTGTVAHRLHDLLNK